LNSYACILYEIKENCVIKITEKYCCHVYYDIHTDIDWVQLFR